MKTWARILFVLFMAGLISASDTVLPCWGLEKASDDPLIVLDVKDEPLRSVLRKIYKKTGWTITVGEKWLNKPITERSGKIPLEEGLKSILRDVGIESHMLIYDKARKVITVVDSESTKGNSGNRSFMQMEGKPPVFSTDGSPDSGKRPVREAEFTPPAANPAGGVSTGRPLTDAEFRALQSANTPGSDSKGRPLTDAEFRALQSSKLVGTDAKERPLTQKEYEKRVLKK